MVAGVWDAPFYPPPFRAGERASVGARERVQMNCGWDSIAVPNWTHRDGGVGVGMGRGGGSVGSMVPGVQACCQRLTKGAPFRGGSWGFLGEEVVCAGGCDAWGVCHSGRGCGCHEECHRDSGRSRWPFHWVLAGHSQSALWFFEETGRKQWDRDG